MTQQARGRQASYVRLRGSGAELTRGRRLSE